MVYSQYQFVGFMGYETIKSMIFRSRGVLFRGDDSIGSRRGWGIFCILGIGCNRLGLLSWSLLTCGGSILCVCSFCVCRRISIFCGFMIRKNSSFHPWCSTHNRPKPPPEYTCSPPPSPPSSTSPPVCQTPSYSHFPHQCPQPWNKYKNRTQ